MKYNRQFYIENIDLELQEQQLLHFFDCEEPLVIFDIGACEGESSIRYSRLFKNASIHCFEAIPSNAELIRQNLAKFGTGNVKLHPVALADVNSKINFRVSSGTPPDAAGGRYDWNFGNKSSTMFEPTEDMLNIYPWLNFEQVITVHATTIGNVLAEEGLSRIDFAHIDAEGSELKILTGAGRFIEKVSVIWLEVVRAPLLKGAPVKHEIERFLKRQRFIKVLDTVDDLSGDQMWLSRNFYRSRFSAVTRFRLGIDRLLRRNLKKVKLRQGNPL